MEKAKLESKSLTIPAGGVATINELCNTFLIVSVSTITPPKCQIDSGKKFDARPGYGLDLPQGQFFNKLTFYNESVADTTVTVMYGIGKIVSAILLASTEIPVRDVSNAIETPQAMAIGTAAAVPLVAVAGQREIVVQNTGVYSVWFGDANVNPVSFRGTEIPSGERIVITTAATVYFRAAGNASSISLNILKTV